MNDTRQEVADRYYAEGRELVEQGDKLWAQAHDSERPADMRAVAMHAYRVNAMRACSKFKRHDMLLDSIARADA